MKNWFKVFLLFFILGLLVYFNSLNNKFLIDDYTFLNNPFFSSTKFISSQWNPYGMQAAGGVSQVMNSYYRPMAHMVLDIYYDTFKNNLWQYHLLNLFLFVFASSLIYLLIEKITGNYKLAFLTGLFYLIHPINGIVVDYISACVFSFQVIFMLGAILFLWESLERKNNPVLYALSLLFSFLALFWNESGIMTTFYASAVILLFRDDSYKKKALYLFPFFLIIFSYIVFRFFFVSINESVLKQVALFHMTAGEYLGTLFRVFMWYITQLFYPRGIVMAWATPILHEHLFWNSLGVISLLIFFVLLFVRFAKEKVCQLAIIWTLIGLFPVCLAAFRRPDNGAQVEPHWFIFSSIGFFILIAYFFLIILDHTKKAGLVLLFIVIFGWGAASHAYNQVWADQKTYARFWSQQVPSLKLTYLYSAEAYQKEGDFKESRKYYQLALGNTLDNIQIYNNLGVMDEQDGHWKEAELNYRRALRINPFSGTIYNNLGYIYFNEGQQAKAKEYFLQALVYNPLLLEPRVNLAKVYLNDSEYQKAVGLCLKNLDIVNDDPETLLLLIDIFIREKDLVSVKKYAYRFINIETDPKILTKFGIHLVENNFPELALDCFTRVMHVAPDYKDAYLATGTLFANFGKYDEAIHIWKLGSSIDASDNRFKESIAKALVKLRAF